MSDNIGEWNFGEYNKKPTCYTCQGDMREKGTCVSVCKKFTDKSGNRCFHQSCHYQHPVCDKCKRPRTPKNCSFTCNREKGDSLYCGVANCHFLHFGDMQDQIVNFYCEPIERPLFGRIYCLNYKTKRLCIDSPEGHYSIAFEDVLLVIHDAVDYE